MTRVLICGGRWYSHYRAIKRYVATLPAGTVVAHGGARGADTLAGKAATERGLQVEVFLADWGLHGRAAGVIRNQQMLEEFKPDLVAYFHEDLTRSAGTVDMVLRARDAGVPLLDGHATYWEPRN